MFSIFGTLYFVVFGFIIRSSLFIIFIAFHNFCFILFIFMKRNVCARTPQIENERNAPGWILSARHQCASGLVYIFFDGTIFLPDHFKPPEYYWTFSSHFSNSEFPKLSFIWAESFTFLPPPPFLISNFARTCAVPIASPQNAAIFFKQIWFHLHLKVRNTTSLLDTKHRYNHRIPLAYLEKRLRYRKKDMPSIFSGEMKVNFVDVRTFKLKRPVHCFCKLLGMIILFFNSEIKCFFSEKKTVHDSQEVITMLYGNKQEMKNLIIARCWNDIEHWTGNGGRCTFAKYFSGDSPSL